MIPTFQAVSRVVVLRLFLAQWFHSLGRSAMIVFPLAAVGVAGGRLSGLCNFSMPTAVIVVAGWLAFTALWAWRRRPTPVTALANWDARTGRQEMFTSAWCFETQEAIEDGQQLHLARAQRCLPEAVASLRRDVPTPLPHGAWAMPLVFLCLVLWLPATRAPADPWDDDEIASAMAKEAAKKLADSGKLPANPKGLTAEEAKKLKKLQSAIQETAKNLEKVDRANRRDVLGELEQRAHEAEKLADAMQDPAEDSPASKMIAELERHADTSDLASALRSKSPSKSAEEAKKLAERLKQKDLALEESKRIENAFDKSLAAADKAEKTGTLGKHLAESHQRLQANQPREAADPLMRLAKQFTEAAQRQNAQRQLQQLANQLRNAGQQALGQQSAGIRRLAQNQQAPGAGLRPMGAQSLQAPLGNLPLPAQLAMTPAPLGVAPQGAMPSPTPGAPNATPVPGAGQIPGAGAGQGQNPGMASGQGAGGTPVPGSGAASAAAAGAAGGMAAANGAGVGGTFAGRGTAAYGNTATKPLDANKTGVVNAAASKDGPSQLRNVEPGQRREESQRQSQQLAANFIKAEEDALAAEPLPLSRREQVIRYFTALRSHFVEHQPSTPERSTP